MFDRRGFIKASGQVGLSSLAFSSAKALASVPKITKHVQKKYSKKKLQILYPKGSLGNIKPVSDLFTKVTGVVIELVESRLDEISAEVLLDTKLGKNKVHVDIALPPTFSIPDLVEAGAVKELSEFARNHEPKNLRDDWYYSLGDFYKGKLYGYQTDGDTYLMFYNKRLLNNLELKRSYQEKYAKTLTIPGTWEELDRQIQFFHDPTKKRYGGCLFRNPDYVVWEFWSRLHAKGLFPVDQNFESQLASEHAVQALSEMVSTTKYLKPSVMTDGLFANWKSFEQDDSFCNIGWGGTQKYLRSSKGMKNNIEHGLLPGGIHSGKEFHLPYFNWGWNYVVLKTSRSQELAYLFCLFASLKNSSIKAIRDPDGYFDPFMKSHYEDDVIKKVYGEKFLQVHKKSLRQSIPDFYVKSQGLYFSALKEGINAVIIEQLTPKNALSLVHKKWSRITKNAGRKSQMEQWEFLRNSYPEYLKKILR